MIVFPLIQKIAELFLIIFAAAALVKAKILHREDGRVLSRVSLYFVTPCVIFYSFQQDLTPEVYQGLLTAVLLAVLFHLIFIFIAWILRRIWKATEVEQASIIFTNCGNLIIPIVSYTLGQEWVIYISASITVFNVLCWTYGIRLFDRDTPFQLKSVLLNPNILAVILGLTGLFTGFRLPEILDIAFGDVAGMIGPLSMIITGIVLGSMNFRKLFSNRRVIPVVLFRMLLCSGAAVFFAILSGISSRIPSGHQIVMIALFCAIAPSASNINQLAILYNHDVEYATSINILTMLSSIITMPFWIYIYEKFA